MHVKNVQRKFSVFSYQKTLFVWNIIMNFFLYYLNFSQYGAVRFNVYIKKKTLASIQNAFSRAVKNVGEKKIM